VYSGLGDNKIRRLIQEGYAAYDLPIWGRLSTQAFQFVDSLLQVGSA
jgi:hypothetical protein